MRSIALFFILILNINIASSMVVGFTYKPIETECSDSDITIVEDVEGQEIATCCSSEESKDDSCCGDDCDCSCCHHIAKTSSQISNQISEMGDNQSEAPGSESIFAYKSSHDLEISLQLLQPPQSSL